MALPEDDVKPEDQQTAQPDTAEPVEVAETAEPEAPEESSEQAAAGETVDPAPEDALQQAMEEVQKYRDLALRAEAEMQNMRRRTARDIENAHKFGLERFLQNLIPVVDSLEKAIEASEQATTDASDAIAEGVSLCHKLLIDVLGKENVEVIDPVGEPFDPNEHQAMSMVENPDMEPNSVFAVVQKGYKLNGRLVRAAMVMVTKAPAAES